MWKLTKNCRIVFSHANGDSYKITRNGGELLPGYLFKPPGTSGGDQRSCTNNLTELARLALFDRFAVRCKRYSTKTQEYCRFREDELIGYEIGPEIAAALEIPATGNVCDAGEDSAEPAEDEGGDAGAEDGDGNGDGDAEADKDA